MTGMSGQRLHLLPDPPMKPSQGFYDRHERPEIARLLDRAVRELRKVERDLGGIRTCVGRVLVGEGRQGAAGCQGSRAGWSG